MTFLKHPDSVYIGGEWQAAPHREAVINPADESLLIEAPVGSAEQVEAAIAAARHAFDHSDWPHVPMAHRQALMSRFLDAIDERRDEIVRMIVAEAGATQMLAGFLQYGIPMKHARRTVEVASRPPVTSLPVELTPNAQGTTTLGTGVVSREPVGVVAAISPYNFPFFLNIGKVVPALLAGCTVVLKPSPYTPMEALILGEIADQVGLPKGVLSIVTGDIEAGRILTSDPRVDLVHFTGSDKVGEAIQAQGAPTLKRIVMELGGKSALIVRPDADLAQAAMAGLGGFTVHCGQGCALTTRLLVHNSVRAQFVESLKGMLGHVKIGNPSDPTVSYGPLIREVARKRTEQYVAIAQDEGATLVAGGKRPAGFDKGFFFEPTLFDNVRNDSRIAQEEVFGPVGAVIGFDDDEEAIALANASDFGLAGAIYSTDAGKAYEMALRLRTGGVAINGGAGTMLSDAPFGGIKRSGYGREYGEDGLNEFTYQKVISFSAK
ncbi:acyl-CoA reductase-like NAD-dependent aldehyde dehydrogenase [Novosphingobium kunmingense]|uniref:Acyl-CoA reductase-like NAD-dependent aldehyde dehydrogenase n=1 Tax=Novosphingobium kunmingense TaxID=1211806 RepID=A0A2N0H626_9SPHN|nr:aldehyde dehydrogenase family protein [Novosphingobium kunmingense]PKB14370.1 acyl-CoA reductase-like NAD-dependent aldehyde dehydrogenase [Novosphingobium kunmingense]